MTGTGRRARMSAVAAGGMGAETEFVVHRRLSSALVIEARPATGRKHQIRAHLASRGLQVLGDARCVGATAIAGVAVGRVMRRLTRFARADSLPAQ
jgi:23S rRNA-/tRNA-specific pseudouridylate synthase